MYIKYLDENQSDVIPIQKSDYEHYYEITPQNLGPFDKSVSDEQFKDFMDAVERFSLNFKLKHLLNSKSKNSSDCYKWTITQNFEYTNHGVVTLKLDTDRSTCDYNKGKV